MSTVTAIGPALDVDGPLPVAPPYGLLSIPGVVQDAGRELNGVNVDAYPVDTPFAWEPCASGTFRDKEDGEEPPRPRFDPVGLYVPIVCSSISRRDWRAFADRAMTALEARISFGVEFVLSQGVTGSSNPFFADGGVTVLGGGAVTAQGAFSYLENAIGETGQKGIIHADPATVFANSDRIRVVGDHLETYNGNYVAAGGGYIGADAGANPAAGQSYAFATGLVKVWLGERRTVEDDLADAMDRSINLVTYRAEQYVLAMWDTALQSAVLTDWTP